MNLAIRALTDSDAQKVAELCNNKKIWDNVRDILPNPYSESDALEFIGNCKEEDPQLTFAIEHEGELVGVIGLVPQADIYRLSAEVGYWVGEPYWGQGFATQAVKLIVDYGFNHLGLVRIYSGVFDFNKASQRVMEKAGFKREGIFEKSVIKNGIIIDEYRYAIVKSIVCDR